MNDHVSNLTEDVAESFRGQIVVFEGPDAVGKSTQAQIIHQKLKDLLGKDSVILVREPGGTPFGENTRKLIKSSLVDVTQETIACLMFASRLDLVKNVLLPNLAMNKVILMDRFLLSSWVYQHHAGGVSEKLLAALSCAVVAQLDCVVNYIVMPATFDTCTVLTKNREGVDLDVGGDSEQFIKDVCTGYSLAVMNFNWILAKTVAQTRFGHVNPVGSIQEVTSRIETELVKLSLTRF